MLCSRVFCLISGKWDGASCSKLCGSSLVVSVVCLPTVPSTGRKPSLVPVLFQVGPPTFSSSLTAKALSLSESQQMEQLPSHPPC